MSTLAMHYRPKKLDDLIGQQDLVKILKKMIHQNHLMSMILYGTPGSGKTTIAKIVAEEANIKYHLFNAVTGSKKDLDFIFNETKFFEKIIIIIDEIHRLNKDKQDLLLPYVESGKLILIGATTSNPLFAINPAIRSRVHLFEVKKANEQEIEKRLEFIVKDYYPDYHFDNEVLKKVAQHVNGDIRYALNIIELLSIEDKDITLNTLNQFKLIPNIGIDKDGDGHYDLVSAFQKSIRGSDVNAALYYLAALIQSNDFDSIYRRLSVTAYEDIGLANPNLVSRVANALEIVKNVGLNEGRIILSNIVIECCLSPKSKSAEQAIDSALSTLNQVGLIIPEYLKLTPVYIDPNQKYDYNNIEAWRYIQYLPDKLKNKVFYQPWDNQYENMLQNNYNKLNQNRTNDLRKLKK